MAKRTPTLSLKLTRAEFVEVIRALELIMQEDDSCNVNMDEASVAAKTSAMKKLERASGLKGPNRRMTESMEGATSVDVRDWKKS